MDIILISKAGEIFRRLREMEMVARSGGGVIYEGTRSKDGTPVVCRRVIKDDKIKGMKLTKFDPAPSRAVYDHSQEFEWGYGGSGPARLALALILDATGDKKLARDYHQEFKERFVAGWGESWSIHAEQIRYFIKLHQEYYRKESG